MASKLLSKGTKYEIASVAAPTTFTKIYGTKSFSGLNSGSASIIDTTDFDSVAKEKLLGLPDEGAFTLGVDWMPADPGQLAIDAARLTGSAVNFRVTLTTGDVYTCAVLVQSFEKMASVDQIWTGSAKMEVTGSVTHSTGGSSS